MEMNWVVIALLSALFTSLRYIHIKKKCSSHPPEIIIFATRFTGAVVLLPVTVFIGGVTVYEVPTFALVTTLTVLSTAFAVVIQVSLLQREDISRSVPFLSFIPVFMIPWSLLLLGEAPGYAALSGIVFTCIGSYVINLKAQTGFLSPILSLFSERPSRFMLVVSMVLAFNTICDKIAIAASSAFSYIYCWTVASTIVMGLICLRKYPVRTIIAGITNHHVIIQSLFWVGGYSCQMFAIRAAFGVSSGTTYVRALTLLNILITVIIGGSIFREKNLARKSLATFLMVCGAVIIVLSSGVLR